MKLTLSTRIWIALVLLGFSGQLAWGVENQFFNTFDPLMANSSFTPERVKVRQVDNPPQRGDRLTVALPPAAAMVIVCNGSGG